MGGDGREGGHVNIGRKMMVVWARRIRWRNSELLLSVINSCRGRGLISISNTEQMAEVLRNKQC